MTDTLVRRYTYGNFASLSAFGAESDFFLGIPARQRELVYLAKAQVTAQKEAAKSIVESNIAGSRAICRELSIQTERLEQAIQSGSDSVVSAIGELADRVAGELGEIRWELLQLRAVSEQILAVLRQPRSTEALELLNQGIRNLVNDKLEQAEDRFKLGLRLDNTDYQILMNLSAVELRKGNAREAVAFVHDALTLPPDLDPQARADALWHLARIYYGSFDYQKAFEHGQQSTAICSTPRRILQLGVYSVLSGKLHQGLTLVESAIRQEPRLFAVAASTPDLADHQSETLRLLGALSAEAQAEFQERSQRLKAAINDVGDFTAVSPRQFDRFRRRFEAVIQAADEGSYSQWRQDIETLSDLHVIPGLFRSLHEFSVDLTVKQQAEFTASQDLALARQRVERSSQKGIGCVPWIAAFAAGGVATAIGMDLWPKQPESSGTASLLLTNIAFWGVLAVTYIAIGRYESHCTRRASESAEIHKDHRTAVELAKSRLVDAERSLATALSKAGC